MYQFISQLELHELDLRNNRLSRLPLVWENIVSFKVDGNFNTVPGPYLGTQFLIRDLKFNEPDLNRKLEQCQPAIHPTCYSSIDRNVTQRKPKCQVIEERPNSAESSTSKSTLSSSSSKSSITSLIQSDENIISLKKHSVSFGLVNQVLIFEYCLETQVRFGTKSGP